MMKMHGLGDAAYWSVQYLWYTCLYLVYMFVLVGFGSAINLQFFRLTEYGFTFVFFILWGNTMVASSFLVSFPVLSCLQPCFTTPPRPSPPQLHAILLCRSAQVIEPLCRRGLLAAWRTKSL